MLSSCLYKYDGEVATGSPNSTCAKNSNCGSSKTISSSVLFIFSRRSMAVGANGQLIGYCLFNSSKYCNILAWPPISYVNMNTNIRNKSLSRIKMWRWSDAAHLERNPFKSAGWFSSQMETMCTTIPIVFFCFGGKWYWACMSNKKCCYRSTVWRTQHRSIMGLIKNVLEKTLKSQTREEEDGTSGAQRADKSLFFFLHILGTADMTGLVTALCRSKVQSTWSRTASSSSAVSRKVANSARVEIVYCD